MSDLVDDKNLTIRDKKPIINNIDAGWSSLEARRAHNPEVIGSNPIPATMCLVSSVGRAEEIGRASCRERV